MNELNNLQTALNDLKLAHKEFLEVAKSYESGMIKIGEVIQRLISDEMVDSETKSVEEMEEESGGVNDDGDRLARD